jgi:Pseudomurein-binding repeat
MIIKKAIPILIGLIMLLSIGASAAATANSTTSYNTTQITQAATAVKYNVEHKYTLPNNVTVGNTQITNPEFLYILSTATANAAKNNKSNIAFKNVSKATAATETTTGGTLTKAQYLTVAGQINSYIKTNGRLPNYVNTAVGTMKYSSLEYMFSKIMAFYGTNKVLPTTVAVKSWYTLSLGPAATLNGTAKYTSTLLGQNSLGYVLKVGTFGTGTTKVAVIVGVHPLEVQTHIAMLNAIMALSKTLNNVQITVFDVVVKNGADYTTGRAAGQTLASEFVVPNIGTSYKMVMDCHGNTGKGTDYSGYPNFVFAPLQNTGSSAIATKLINSNMTKGDLKYHFLADGTSPQYVTIPIAKKGIPTIVYEQYINQANYAQVLYQHALQVLEAINATFAK